MLILAVDTSTEVAGVGLTDGPSPVSQIVWRRSGSHSRYLTGAIEEALHVGAVSVHDLGAVVVSIGPGSFSGIRVGVSEAKGLAAALGVPLVGISTLDAIALEASQWADSVWALVPAGRGRAYAAHFVGRGQSWSRQGAYRLFTSEELQNLREAAETSGGSTLLVGDPDAAESSPTERALGLCRTWYLAELGSRYLAAGGADQLHTIEPLYLRRSAAEEKRAAAIQE